MFGKGSTVNQQVFVYLKPFTFWIYSQCSRILVIGVSVLYISGVFLFEFDDAICPHAMFSKSGV